jgi:ABC-type uncharacterized transport system substrate-binding protein
MHPRFAALAAILILAALFCGRAHAQDLTAPIMNGAGKWRLAYVEGGPLGNYQWQLKALVLGFGRLGWAKVPAEFASMRFADEKAQWEWIGLNVESPWLEFVRDAFWSFGWDSARREAGREEAIARLAGGKDIDAVIAMGTWAGQDLANDSHQTPVFVFQASDPVSAGIVKGVAFSGRPHVFAHCDPTRYKRQVRLFHDVVKFGKLGIAYEDTPNGRLYAAVDDAREVCKALGVTLVECHALTHTPDLDQAVKSYQACHERLAGEVDAMYVTNSAAVTPKTLPGLLKPFLDAKAPTFAQMGMPAVRRGALLGMSLGDHSVMGVFAARTISQVFHGAKPGELPQVFEDQPGFALNLDTAKAIGFEPPPAFLAAAVTVRTEQGP